MSEPKLPPSLAVVPNIPWGKQTLEELLAERDYWKYKLETAPGNASASTAHKFLKCCEGELAHRERKSK